MGYIKKLDSRYGTTHKVANWEIVRWYVEPFIKRVKVEVGTFDSSDTQIGKYDPLEVTTYTFKMSQFEDCINESTIEDVLSTHPDFKQSVRIDPEEIVIFGCMDDKACNFNEEATHDDGSCVYPPKSKEVDERNQPIVCNELTLKEASNLLDIEEELKKKVAEQNGDNIAEEMKIINTRIRSLEICIKLKTEEEEEKDNPADHS